MITEYMYMENNAARMFANIRAKERNKILSYENLYHKCRNVMLNRIDKARKNNDSEETRNLEAISSWAVDWMKDIQGQTEYLIKKGAFTALADKIKELSDGIFSEESVEEFVNRLQEDVKKRSEEYARLNADE